jgi:hypothetical protein
MLAELFRSTDNEFFFRVDNPADEIGYPSGGKRGVRASLEDDNLHLGATTFCLRCGTHSGCIASDYDQFFSGHGSLSFIQTTLEIYYRADKGN